MEIDKGLGIPEGEPVTLSEVKRLFQERRDATGSPLVRMHCDRFGTQVTAAGQLGKIRKEFFADGRLDQARKAVFGDRNETRLPPGVEAAMLINLVGVGGSAP